MIGSIESNEVLSGESFKLVLLREEKMLRKMFDGQNKEAQKLLKSQCHVDTFQNLVLLSVCFDSNSGKR